MPQRAAKNALGYAWQICRPAPHSLHERPIAADILSPNPAQPIFWGASPTSRALGHIYTNEQLYQKELAQLFYKGCWCHVGLECEIPKPGDFKRNKIGERSVQCANDFFFL